MREEEKKKGRRTKADTHVEERKKGREKGGEGREKAEGREGRREKRERRRLKKKGRSEGEERQKRGKEERRGVRSENHLILKSIPHPPHSFKHPLFMTVHLCECSDLCQIYVLPVTKGNNLIKCKYQVKHIVQYVLFI